MLCLPGLENHYCFRNTKVAVKRLFCSGKLTFREVKNEMKVLAKIRHKNIAKITGFCYSEGEVSIIYEYFRKGSLQDMICAPKFKIGRAHV